MKSLQQLSIDYNFNFTRFVEKLNQYPTQLNITNSYFITVPFEDQMLLVDGIIVYVNFIYLKLGNEINFNLSFQNYLDSVNIARKQKLHIIGKAEDALREAAFTLIEMKDAHNKPLNTQFFSQQFQPLIAYMLNENIKHGNFDSYSKEFIPEIAKQFSGSQSTFEHIMPFNITMKLLLKFYHLALQQKFDKTTIKEDFIQIILILKQVAAITRIENSRLDISHARTYMPNQFFDSTSELYLDPWARYKVISQPITIHKYNI